MNIVQTKLTNSTDKPKSKRAVWAAVLLAALAVAVLAGSALAATKLLKNGSFEKDSDGDGIPNTWTGNSLSSKDKRDCNQSHAGACSFKTVAEGTVKTLTQTFGLPGLSGDEFTFSAWMKGKNIVNGAGSASVVVQIDHIVSGTTFRVLALPEGNSAWAFQTVTFTADQDYDDIHVYTYVNATSGKAWFDQVKLVGP